MGVRSLIRQMLSRDVIGTTQSMLPVRDPYQAAGQYAVTPDSAMRASAVWACLRLRADLVSATPVGVFSLSGEIRRSVAPPTLLTTPGGSMMSATTGAPNIVFPEWMYSTQVDLDRYGNCFGIVTLRDGYGLPARVELVPAGVVKVLSRGQEITGYWVDGTKYEPMDIWHERQYTAPGLPIGMSPITWAAWTISGYMSAQKFALDWFSSGTAPTGVLRNTMTAEMDPKVVTEAKSRFRAAVSNRDIFVTGKEWEWTLADAPGKDAGFLDLMRYSVVDVCRFMGVPGDMIDADSSTRNITYANVTQRNLQLLTINMSPVFKRREIALSCALPAKRYMKFDTDGAVLRMDPETRSKVTNGKVLARVLAPSEAREMDNRLPFTPEQIAEFDMLAVPVGTPKKGGEVE